MIYPIIWFLKLCEWRCRRCLTIYNMLGTLLAVIPILLVHCSLFWDWRIGCRQHIPPGGLDDRAFRSGFRPVPGGFIRHQRHLPFCPWTDRVILRLRSWTIQ